MAQLYTISYNLTNCTTPVGTPIDITTTAVINIIADTGFNLPNEISVTGSDYTWSQDTATILLSNPTSNVTISVACTGDTFTLDKTLSHVTASPQIPSTIDSGATIETTITADEGYGLPTNIIVSGCQFIWSKNTGRLILTNATNNVIMLVEGVEGQTGLMGVSIPSQERNGQTLFNICYGLDKYQVNDFIDELNNQTFLTNFALLFSEPTENIVNLVMYPFNVKALSKVWQEQNDERIKVNIVKMKSKGLKLYPISTPIINLGSLYIKPHYNSFLDYKPYTNIELYLPYIGFVELDNQLVINQTITVKYSLDIQHGTCTAFVVINSNTINEQVIMQREGQLGVSLQIGGGGSNKIAKSLLNLAISTASTTISDINHAALKATTYGMANVGSPTDTPTGSSANPISRGLDLTNGVINASQYHVSKGKISDTMNNFYAPQNMFVVYYRTNVQYPTSYGNDIGYPLMATRKLYTLNGFTKIYTCHIEGENFKTATEDEKREIDSLLRSGILLQDGTEVPTYDINIFANNCTYTPQTNVLNGNETITYTFTANEDYEFKEEDFDSYVYVEDINVENYTIVRESNKIVKIILNGYKAVVPTDINITVEAQEVGLNVQLLVDDIEIKKLEVDGVQIKKIEIIEEE